jgi:hypothetical protein
MAILDPVRDFRDDGGAPAWRARQAEMHIGKRGLLGWINRLPWNAVLVLILLMFVLPWLAFPVGFAVMAIMNLFGR